jgi:hypothetical protein
MLVAPDNRGFVRSKRGTYGLNAGSAERGTQDHQDLSPQRWRTADQLPPRATAVKRPALPG